MIARELVDDLLRKPMVNVPELAVVLGICRASAYNAVNRGDIASVRIGKRVLVPNAEVRRVLGRA
jgi:excisionase family DNA binding protein